MAFPNLTTGRVDRLVTNVLLAQKNTFLADKIFPVIPNLKDETGLLGKLSNNHMRKYVSKRSLYDENSHRIEFKYSQSDRYNIDFYDLEVYLPDRVRDQMQTPFDARRDAGFTVDQALMLEREIGIATIMSDSSILTNGVTLSGTSKFSDYDNSTPETVIETGRTSVFNATGNEANVALMSRAVANTLKAHPFFLDLAKRNAGQSVQNINLSQFVELFKSYFELDEVLIGKARYINSMEGQTETITGVWGDNITLFYRPASPGLMQTSLGYCFTFAGANKRVDIRRHPNDLGDIVREMVAYQDMLLDANNAYLIKSAI